MLSYTYIDVKFRRKTPVENNNCKVALVTGSSGQGIGRSIAIKLAEEGYQIAVNYKTNQNGAEEVVQYILKSGGKARAIQANVFSQKECEKLFHDIIQTFGRLDILIISPGADWNPESIQDLNPIKSLQDIEQEVLPVYSLLPLAFTEMSKRNWGRIIGISTNMDIPSPSYSYNLAKIARKEALMLAVNDAWNKGITINVVSPGPINHYQDIKEVLAPDNNEIISPNSIAKLVTYLVSTNANYITGNEIKFRF